MKLYRQDGSEVELTEEDAQKWLKLGLAIIEKNGGANKTGTKPKVAAKQNE